MKTRLRRDERRRKMVWIGAIGGKHRWLLFGSVLRI